MISDSSPWLTRFAALTDEEIERRTRFSPPAVTGMDSLNPGVATRHLSNTLSQIFEPTPASLHIHRRMVDAAEQFAREAFPSREMFRRRLYNFEGYQSEMSPWNPVCVTGLSGGGKTSLFVAAARILQDETVDAGAGHTLPLIGLSYLAIEDERSELDVLQSTWRALSRKRPDVGASPYERARLQTDDVFAKKKLKDARKNTALMAYRSGCCGVIVDEMQFMTQGSTANTLVTKTLLELSYLRFPFFFAANFNLVAKLRSRPPQDRDRLLSDPIVVLPDTLVFEAAANAWKAYLRVCVRVSGNVIALDMEKDAEPLLSYTFGLRRKFIFMIKQAYGRAREAGKFTIQMRDVEEAYKSTAYFTHRKDVESLKALEVTGKSESKEFVCPFEVDSTEMMTRQKRAMEESDRVVAEQMVVDSLSPAEKLLYHQAGGPRPDSGEKAKTSGRVRTAVSGSSLIAGSNQFHGRRK